VPSYMLLLGNLLNRTGKVIKLFSFFLILTVNVVDYLDHFVKSIVNVA
jgi:hypothetical protein